ncbi:MAG TPA: diacylglycerol kinase family protein [Allosphingosinicella sp.]|nr:diacylglycerol kinase family protein [Allosphingosinicella sp.]
MKVVVIVNRGGGSADGAEERIREAFEGTGMAPDVRLVEPGDLDRLCAEIGGAGDVAALVAAGGDGTVSTVAAAVAGTGVALGVLPMGTLNHFARDSGIPLDLEAAAAAIAAGRTRRIDAAEVNGRLFVNNSVVGLYPALVRDREAQQRHFGRSKRLAMLVAAARAAWRFSSRRLTLRIAGMKAPVETPLLFVGNNKYETGLLGLGRRAAIDQGELCVYAPLARSRFGFVWLSLRAVIGRPDRQRDFLTLDGIEEAEVHCRSETLMVAADGEASPMKTPLKYRIRKGALKLILPIGDGEGDPA